MSIRVKSMTLRIGEQLFEKPIRLVRSLVYPLLLILVVSGAGCGWYGRIHAAKGEPFAPVLEIPEGMSVVYVYGPLGYGRYKYPIVLNDEVIVTELKKGGYHPCIVSTGQLKITMIEWGAKQRKEANKAAVVGTITNGLATGILMSSVAGAIPDISHSTTLNVEPGKSYYVEHVGTLFLNLEEKTEEEAMPKLSKCVLLPPFSLE